MSMSYLQFEFQLWQHCQQDCGCNHIKLIHQVKQPVGQVTLRVLAKHQSIVEELKNAITILLHQNQIIKIIRKGYCI